jgi:hypothetical protein
MSANSSATGPANRGYSLPASAPVVSGAAALVRAAAVNANISSYELSAKSRSIIDQRELPCCVSSALGAAMEVLNPGWPALAPLFHYYVARYDDGGADAAGFLYLDNGLGTLSGAGICRRDLHPVAYDDSGSRTRPSPSAYADGVNRALRRRGVRFRFEQASGPSNTAWIRDQLRLNHPVILGMRLPVGYPDGFLNERFEWLDPESSQLSLSGHCVLVTGFKDLRRAIHIQDSRGTARFDRGCWWMGYRIVDSSIVQQVYSLIP